MTSKPYSIIVMVTKDKDYIKHFGGPSAAFSVGERMCVTNS